MLRFKIKIFSKYHISETRYEQIILFMALINITLLKHDMVELCYL